MYIKCIQLLSYSYEVNAIDKMKFTQYIVKIVIKTKKNELTRCE